MALATSASNISSSLLNPPAIYRTIDRDYLRNTRGGTSFNNNTYSNAHKNSLNVSTPLPQHELFVTFIKKINHEYDELKTQLEGFLKNTIQNKLEYSLSSFLALNADALSVELTAEAILFYTIKKNNFTIYIDQYLDTITGANDEFVLTAFEQKKMLNNKTGSFYTILLSIQDIIC